MSGPHQVDGTRGPLGSLEYCSFDITQSYMWMLAVVSYGVMDGG